MVGSIPDAELFARLISFPSVSRNSNLPIAEFICNYFDESAFEVVRQPSPDGAKVNLLIRTRGVESEGGEGLMFCGHMDVVPAEESGWRSDPFTLTDTGEAFVARGACDMKGSVALMMNALRSAGKRHLKRPAMLLLTYDEEPGTLGAQHFARTWDPKAKLSKSVIIGEPTSLRVVRVHKGHLKMRVTTRGRSAHSGYPSLGVNAIEPMGDIISALSKLRKRLATQRPEMGRFFPEAPHVVMNLGMLSAGTAVNIIPDRCVLDLGLRVLPGMASSGLVEEIRGLIKDACPGGSAEVEVLHETPPLLTSERSSIHRLLCEFVGQTQSWGASYASDAGPLCAMGLECVLLGPGTIEVAHKANESLPKSEFVAAGQLLERALRSLCEGG